jgi:hypothetical protein
MADGDGSAHRGWGRWGGLEEAKNFFRGDLICDYKQYLAFLDGGLYDNLGLASVEDIRHFLGRSTNSHPSDSRAVHYVIATDVDQIPTQFSAYSDPEMDRLLGKQAPRPSASAGGGLGLAWFAGCKSPLVALQFSCPLR